MIPVGSGQMDGWIDEQLKYLFNKLGSCYWWVSCCRWDHVAVSFESVNIEENFYGRET